MAMEPIKNFWGQIMGYIETRPNGDKVAYNFYKQILGYYDVKRNVTMDFYKRVIAKGDAVASFISLTNDRGNDYR